MEGSVMLELSEDMLVEVAARLDAPSLVSLAHTCLQIHSRLLGNIQFRECMDEVRGRRFGDACIARGYVELVDWALSLGLRLDLTAIRCALPAPRKALANLLYKKLNENLFGKDSDAQQKQIETAIVDLIGRSGDLDLLRQVASASKDLAHYEVLLKAIPFSDKAREAIDLLEKSPLRIKFGDMGAESESFGTLDLLLKAITVADRLDLLLEYFPRERLEHLESPRKRSNSQSKQSIYNSILEMHFSCDRGAKILAYLLDTHREKLGDLGKYFPSYLVTLARNENIESFQFWVTTFATSESILTLELSTALKNSLIIAAMYDNVSIVRFLLESDLVEIDEEGFKDIYLRAKKRTVEGNAAAEILDLLCGKLIARNSSAFRLLL